MARLKYVYKGPIFLSDKFIEMINLEVWANSREKAKNDILDQVKKQLNCDKDVKLRISDNSLKQEELKYGKTV